MTLVEAIARIWYFQTWLVAIGFAAGTIKNGPYAAGVCGFIAYIAVTWYPLLGQLINAR